MGCSSVGYGDYFCFRHKWVPPFLRFSRLRRSGRLCTGIKKAAYSLHKRISGLCNQCDIKFYSVSDTFKISSSTQSVKRPCCCNLFLKRIRLCTTRRVSSLLKYRYLFSFFNITISPPLSIAYKKNGCLSTVRFNLIG